MLVYLKHDHQSMQEWKIKGDKKHEKTTKEKAKLEAY
jgi:hypothetical protein